MTDVKELPPFDEYSRCPKCGHQRGPETKPAVQFHDGEADGRGEVCDVGGAQDHLHRVCTRCQFQWAEACVPNVPPLTVVEISQVRELLAEVHK